MPHKFAFIAIVCAAAGAATLRAFPGELNTHLDSPPRVVLSPRPGLTAEEAAMCPPGGAGHSPVHIPEDVTLNGSGLQDDRDFLLGRWRWETRDKKHDLIVEKWCVHNENYLTLRVFQSTNEVERVVVSPFPTPIWQTPSPRPRGMHAIPTEPPLNPGHC